MKTNPLKEGLLTANSVPIGTVNLKMVRERAGDIAILNGRSAHEASKSDWDQARREMIGEPGADPKDLTLEAADESARWDPVPGSIGSKVTVTPGDDEDSEGRSDQVRLVEEGVAGAEHDQMLRAATESAKHDKA